MKSIKRIARNVHQHWVGDGFPVRSLFSYASYSDFDPFLLLDYAGPHLFTPATHSRGVGEHPHRGFETVTIVFQGELEHRDSAGSQGSIGAGDVQWMTAASGVVHEEYHSERFTRVGGTLEMIQLWVNLRSSKKMSQPRYQSILEAQIPRAAFPNAAVEGRVIAGDLLGTKGAAQTLSPINVWDLQFTSPGETELRIPDGHNSLIVVQTGNITTNDTSLLPQELALFERNNETILLKAKEASRVIVLTGEPLNEPIVGHGPFLMNSREEIQQAIHDFQEGLMGKLR